MVSGSASVASSPYREPHAICSVWRSSDGNPPDTCLDRSPRTRPDTMHCVMATRPSMCSIEIGRIHDPDFHGSESGYGPDIPPDFTRAVDEIGRDQMIDQPVVFRPVPHVLRQALRWEVIPSPWIGRNAARYCDCTSEENSKTGPAAREDGEAGDRTSEWPCRRNRHRHEHAVRRRPVDWTPTASCPSTIGIAHHR